MSTSRHPLGRRGFLGFGLALAATPLLSPGQARAAEPARSAPVPAGAFSFTHPGILHLASDLDRMRSAVAARQAPLYQGFQALAADRHSSASYAVQNTGQITTWGRGPSNYFNQAVADADAAYQNALMWYITGDDAHGDKARDILDAWAGSLTAITGADGQLGAGLQGFKLVNAAEILRHGGYGRWPAADIAACERSFTDVWYPAISGYALYANGNWDLIAMQTVAGIGVFTGNRALFEDALRFAASGAGNGSVLHRIVTAAGQGQESGRDQGHEQLALGMLADVAQLAWNQGVDLFSFGDRRLLANTEYDARYNTGGDVPFVPALDRTGKYLKTAVSATGRGQFPPIYEMLYAHYATVLGLDTPATRQAVFRGAGGSRVVEGLDEDTPSWGTLTFARAAAPAPANPAAPPGAPAGLAATGGPGSIALRWIASAEPLSAAPATGYTVRRAESPAGPWQTLATGLATAEYTDTTVRTGPTYHYTVSAANAAGESPASAPLAATAGLPAPWAAEDVGAVHVAGGCSFDGERFTIEAGGADIGGTADAFHFAHLPLRGDGTVTARLVHPVSSQYAKAGVMMRAGTAPDAPHAAMLLQGLPLVAWSGVWTARAASGADTSATGSTAVPPSQLAAITTNAGFPLSALGSLPASATPLTAPHVEAAGDGYRLRMPYWVRLERRGDRCTGSISPDGAEWAEVGSARLPLGAEVRVGLAATSCLGVAEDWAQTGTAAFDNVTVTTPTGRGWTVPAPTGAVTDLRAAATASGIELTWTDADLSGRWTVHRASRPGGPYRVVATDVGPVGFGARTRWTDTTGVPGQSYAYVVAKTNAGGAGPDSAPATAVMPQPPAPPVLSTAPTAYANRGVPFAFLVTASGDPARFAADGLPEGLRLDRRTGLVSGTPRRAGTFPVTLTAANASGSGSAPLSLVVGTPPPAPWSYQDIGDVVTDVRRLGILGVAYVRTPGSTSYDAASGAFTVRGAGTDLNVNGQGMTGQVVSRQVTGDCVVTARIQGLTLTGDVASARVGLVMLKSLTPFDQMAAAVVSGTGSGGWTPQLLLRKVVAAGAVTAGGAAGSGGSVWLRLRRTGTAFTASVSADGSAWTDIGTDTVPAFGDAPYHAGLVVCSRAPLALCTAVFDQVAVGAP